MDKSSHQLVLYLLRHGETILQNRLVGANNPELSEKGWQQMSQVVDGLDIEKIITSPLQRCLSFAKALAKQEQITAEIQPELTEINFGDWDGKSWDEIPAETAENYFQNPWQYTPPNGEPLVSFDQRVSCAMEQLLGAPISGKWLLIVHGGVIKSIIAWALNLIGTEHHCYTRIHIPHAGVSQLTVNWHQRQRFVSVNSLNQHG